MKYEELYQKGLTSLKKASLREADSDCFILFSEAFSMSRASFYFKKTESIPESECERVKKFEEWIERRVCHEPVQYIIGNQEFYGLTFLVDERVLIPRLDTEILVEEVLKCDTRGRRILDICTGSGCILITAAKLGGFRKAVGTDISEDALEVAEQNAKLNGVEVLLKKGDLFSALEEGECFDIITSNPPYIAESERKELDREVVDHEPSLALFADHDGLIFYERIIKDIGNYLADGGKAFFEIGCNQGKAVSDLCLEAGFKNVKVIKDLAGLDRVVEFEKQSLERK